ncbi:MAG: hypothetical protein NVSMB64_02510 [Candidatus Velthaea sp.]
MSDADQLAAVAQRLTSAILTTYTAQLAGANLAFLPGGVPVPDDIVQSGIINPTQLQTWLAMNFDFPFVVSSGTNSVLSRYETQGTASNIYSLAVSTAQPAGDPTSDAWKRIASEIAAAQRILGPANTPMTLACSPDDWPLPTAQSYWTIFDSTQQTDTTTSTAASPPPVDPRIWHVRMLDGAYDQVSSVLGSGGAVDSTGGGAVRRPELQDEIQSFNVGSVRETAMPQVVTSQTLTPMSATMTAMTDTTAVAAEATPPWRTSIALSQLPVSLNVDDVLIHSVDVDTVTTDSSTISMHLEHLCVSVGRYTAGAPTWNGIFLSDPGWFVPGMNRGQLLAAPSADGASNGIPTAMLLVRNLRLTGAWSQAAQTTLTSASGTLGPLSLFGGVTTTNADGSVTISHDGMQVVGLVCTPLPVLPPLNAPSSIAGSSSGTTPAQT